MAFRFAGKKVIVTGAGRGIGRALAKCISDSGGEVIAVSKSKENLDSLVRECSNIRQIQIDLSSWEDTRAALEHLEPVNGLVNNAGIALEWVPSIEIPRQFIEDAFRTNTMSAVNVSQIVGKKMMETGNGGSIVNMSSVLSISPMRNTLAYTMSKAAMDMMTKQLALELGPHNIRVNSVNPTVVLTDMGKEYWEGKQITQKLLDHTPLGKLAELEEVTGPIMYLLSDYSSMVTGTINPIEGGLLCNCADI